jgi:hypothetical protein
VRIEIGIAIDIGATGECLDGDADPDPDANRDPDFDPDFDFDFDLDRSRLCAGARYDAVARTRGARASWKTAMLFALMAYA